MDDRDRAVRDLGIAINVLFPPELLAKDFVNGFVLSTVNTHDEGWETAIARATPEGTWVPVGRYSDREAAQAGHAMLLEALAAHPTGAPLKLTRLGWRDLPNRDVTI